MYGGLGLVSGLYWAVYQVDNYHSNPYKVWQDAGRPATPSSQLFRRMRDVEVMDYVSHTARQF